MSQKQHIGSLDGLRGTAALWVLSGHCAAASAVRLPLISHPDLAVDLFMMLSGFLMTFHAQNRDMTSSPSLWADFWLRRFFRIAPVYYLTLFASLALGPWLYAHRMSIAHLAPGYGAPPHRYFDHGLGNILAHVTFVFGQIPAYSSRTPLPDWSIGLEMAFYAVFPFLMIGAKRVGMAPLAIVMTVVCFAAHHFLPHLFNSFRMSSFLPIKLDVFFCGMLIATSMRAQGWRRAGLIALACALTVPSMRFSDSVHVAARLVFAMLLAVAVEPQRAPSTLIGGWISGVLGSDLAKRVGEISYSIYLVHELVLLPVADMAAHMHVSPAVRFALTLSLTATITCALSALIFATVEMPGISLGRQVAAWLGLGSRARAGQAPQGAAAQA